MQWTAYTPYKTTNTHTYIHTEAEAVKTSMNTPTHVLLITSELTISSSWSQPLQCCPSALARPPHYLTTYRYSTTYNSTSYTDVHNGMQTVLATLHYNVTNAVSVTHEHTLHAHVHTLTEVHRPKRSRSCHTLPRTT